MRFNRTLLRGSSSFLAHGVAGIPYNVLIRYFLAVRLLLLLAVLLLGGAILVSLLYVTPEPAAGDGGPRPVVLKTELIDQLELWLEERQTESEKPLLPGTRQYFQR